MIITEVLIFTVAFFVAKYFWDYRRFFYLGHKIPLSSFDYSIKGIYRAMNADNKTIFVMLREAFANNVVCTKSWFGTFLFVGIVKPEDVKLVLNSKDCLDKPRFLKFPNIPKGSLFGDVEYWHSHRKLLNPYFGARSLQSVIPIFNQKVKVLMKNFDKLEGKGQFNVLYSMTALTLETIIKVMEYDVDLQSQKSEVRDVFIENLEKFLKIVTVRAFKFWLHPDIIFKSTKLYQKQLETASKTAMGFAKNIILNAQSLLEEDANNNEKSKTFIRALVNSKNNLSSDEIQDEVNTIVLAAQDTSAIASSSTLLLLAMHKDIQQKVVDELHSVFGKTLDAPYLDYEKINELQYLEMVINETMRLLPVVPYVFRENLSDIEISEGYVIPAGAYIMIPIFELHRSKVIWGEDADDFRPERFEKANFEKIPSYAYIPFAKGPRMCVGWRYAMLLMKIQLANILLRYVINTNLKLEELEFQFNITMNVCQGYNISLNERTID
ncbi:probable cytochrome P450 313a4 [Chironomus tepperi]|uniref:probable cytochrome P450 313a4 n=1 Tax=Chironomus tepperi TaxID=113505 RepID=UPI00391F74B3